VIAAALLAALVIAISYRHQIAQFGHGSYITVDYRPEKNPQTSWAPCNRNASSKAPSTFKPLSDKAAAALVTREPETRPDNARRYTLSGATYPAPTVYVPTNAQLESFRSAKTSLGEPVLQFNPYLRYVDGRDGIRNPSTDDLIQWAAHKWGIPENWLRAEYVQESYWSSYQLGDEETVSQALSRQYPPQARASGHRVYQSLGITQVRWDPQGDFGAGTDPLRWESMAFNVDYQAAMVRFYYDNPSGARTAWGDSTYEPCDKWHSIGAWFSAYPWGNGGQTVYIHKVQANLANSTWRTGAFLSWSPSSLPPGIRLLGSGDSGGSHGDGSSRRGSCSGGALCVSLPAEPTRFDLSVDTEDSYGFTASEPKPGGGYPSVWQRLQNLDVGASRALSYVSYNDAYTGEISPVDYYVNSGSGVQYHRAWNFIALDKELSESSPTTPKEVDEGYLVPPPLWYCPSGSWSAPAKGCTWSGSAGIADQSFRKLASYYANLVRYFRVPPRISDSGPAVTYSSRTLTDTRVSFARDTGDCITATVIDSNGFPDWVTGTVSSVGGGGHHTVTLTSGWSSAESYDTELGNGALPSTTPATGAAYNLASCTPPRGLDSPQAAKPWPAPPSIGDVQYFELGNEPDLSNINQSGLSNGGVSAPAVTPPASIKLTGVNEAGGKLTPGTTYTYEIASDGIQAAGTNCPLPAQNNVCGGWSLPSAQQRIMLPSGDNAVQISWPATTNDDQTPYAYEVYGRTSGSEAGLAIVGRNAALNWTDKGTISPSGSPNRVGESAGGNVFTPGLYAQIWNVVAPAMKAVDPTIKLVGPAEANANGYGEPSVNTACVTSNGTNSSCTNGDPGWSISTDYIPTLLKYATPLPNVISFHAYGSYTTDTPEGNTFSRISTYEVPAYHGTDKAAIDTHGIPVWLDETNVDAQNAPNNQDFRSMTQMGSAWLADSLIEWANADPKIQHMLQWSSNSNNNSWELFGLSNNSGDSSCVPQPACRDIRKSQPDLEYWSIYEMNHLLRSGRLVPVGGVPAGFAALAVQTSSNTVVVMLVNTRQGNDDGNGASGTASVEVVGEPVTSVHETAIRGSTSMPNGPSTTDLGAHSHVSINLAGYEVDFLKFTVKR
jgi:hypothetical protein